MLPNQPPGGDTLIPYTSTMLHDLAVGQRRDGPSLPLNISMQGEQCDNTDLSSLTLAGSLFDQVSLERTHLIESSLTLCDFMRCNLHELNAVFSLFPGCAFTHCFMEHANFASTDLSESSFDSCVLERASFASASLVNARFLGYGMNLKSVTFDSAVLVHAHLSGANLKGSTFSSTNLTDANLVACNLDNTYFYCTEMTGANLSRANLHEAVFDNVLLGDTTFSSVEQLLQANLTKEREAITLCCQDSPALMRELHEWIVSNKIVGMWLDAHTMPDAKAHWTTLKRWASNHDLHVPLDKNPPLAILNRWIEEACTLL